MNDLPRFGHITHDDIEAVEAANVPVDELVAEGKVVVLEGIVGGEAGGQGGHFDAGRCLEALRREGGQVGGNVLEHETEVGDSPFHVAPVEAPAERPAPEVCRGDGEGIARPLDVTSGEVVERFEPFEAGNDAGGHQFALFGQFFREDNSGHLGNQASEVGGIRDTEVRAIVGEKCQVTVEAGSEELGDGGKFVVTPWEFSCGGIISKGY